MSIRTGHPPAHTTLPEGGAIRDGRVDLLTMDARA
jgi:hypothetical protein